MVTLSTSRTRKLKASPEKDSAYSDDYPRTPPKFPGCQLLTLSDVFPEDVDELIPVGPHVLVVDSQSVEQLVERVSSGSKAALNVEV